MGKKTKGKPAAAGPEMTMSVLGSTRTREQLRFERAIREAVQTLVRLGEGTLPPKELAASIRRCINKVHGPEWHCLVGEVSAFTVHVRYWRGKSFIFEDAGLRIIVFQSAPPAPEAPNSRPAPESPEPAVEAERARRERDESGGRTSIKVLRSEMDPGYQRSVLATASASAKEAMKGKGGDLDSVVASLKASLTELTGPVWHVVATRGTDAWGYSVAFEEGQLIDFKVNGDRFLCWKHAQAPPGLADMFTMKRISSLLFLAMVVLLGVYVKYQGTCDRCCSSSPDLRAKYRCAGSLSEGEEPESEPGSESAALMERCDEDAIHAADLCLRNAKILLFVTCGTLAIATALKWTAQSKSLHQQ